MVASVIYGLSVFIKKRKVSSRLDSIEELVQKHSLNNLASHFGDYILDIDTVHDISQLIWEKYKKEQLLHSNSTKTFKYSVTTIGHPSVFPLGYPLYIALHGGGDTGEQVNDDQWKQMQHYYVTGIHQGIYIAPRAITNTWDMHWVSDAFPLYDDLIEYAIVHHQVDPNKVYLLGFSAGGDGTYQISARMSDRFAAVNASAGHPNHVSIRNWYHLPIQMQVGEHDAAYDRNKVVAHYDALLNAAHNENENGFKHNTCIHYRKEHNFRDNDVDLQKVYTSPQGWSSGTNMDIEHKNTNAAKWLQQWRRNPLPTTIFWDLTTTAESRRRKSKLFYWLDIGNHTANSLGINEIVVSCLLDKNTIVIQKAATYLKILITSRMFDVSIPIHIEIDKQYLSISVVPTLHSLLNTLTERGDYHYMFESSIELQQQRGQWHIL